MSRGADELPSRVHGDAATLHQNIYAWSRVRVRPRVRVRVRVRVASG